RGALSDPSAAARAPSPPCPPRGDGGGAERQHRRRTDPAATGAGQRAGAGHAPVDPIDVAAALAAPAALAPVTACAALAAGPAGPSRAARVGLDLLLDVVDVAVGHLHEDLVEAVAVGVAEDGGAHGDAEVVGEVEVLAARIEAVEPAVAGAEDRGRVP